MIIIPKPMVGLTLAHSMTINCQSRQLTIKIFCDIDKLICYYELTDVVAIRQAGLGEERGQTKVVDGKGKGCGHCKSLTMHTHLFDGDDKALSGPVAVVVV